MNRTPLDLTRICLTKASVTRMQRSVIPGTGQESNHKPLLWHIFVPDFIRATPTVAR